MKMVKVELTTKQIQQLINMIKAANFRGEHAEEVVKLLRALEEPIKQTNN